MLLALVRKSGGERAVSELLQRATVDRDVAYLEGVHNWISLAEATALLEAAAQLTGDELFARKVGEHTLRQHAGTQVATLLRSLGSAEAVLQAVAQTASKLSAVTKMETVEAVPGRGVVRAVAREGFTRRRVHCDWTAGLLAVKHHRQLSFDLKEHWASEALAASRPAARTPRKRPKSRR